MPLYAIRCAKCERGEEIYRSFANYNDLPECCGERMTREVSAPMVVNDIQPYRSMVTGEIINSRSRHREHLKDHGCIEVGNEKLTPKPVPIPGLKETIIKVAADKLRY